MTLQECHFALPWGWNWVAWQRGQRGQEISVELNDWTELVHLSHRLYSPRHSPCTIMPNCPSSLHSAHTHARTHPHPPTPKKSILRYLPTPWKDLLQATAVVVPAQSHQYRHQNRACTRHTWRTKWAPATIPQSSALWSNAVLHTQFAWQHWICRSA